MILAARALFGAKMNPRVLNRLLQKDDVDGLIEILKQTSNVDVILEISFRSFTFPEFLLNKPTLFFASAYYGAVNCFKYLLGNGASVDGQDQVGRLIVHFAAAGGKMEIISILDEYPGIDWAAPDSQGSTPLYYAIQNHHIETVYWLWSTQGASLCLPNTAKNYPLHVAVSCEDLPIVQFLCENGCDINVKNEYGYTPLHIAATKPNLELVHYLISHGADPTLKDNNECLPYHFAMHYRHQHIQNFLLESVPDATATVPLAVG